MNCQLGSCYKVSDNKHFTCPPKMSDGRHFTDYRPNCHLENIVRNSNDICNSHQYRMFLTHNAESLMNMNRKMACDTNCCGPCNNQQTIAKSDISGETWGVSSDSCPSSDSKFKPNCCSNSTNSMNYYPSAELRNSVSVSRYSSPSGGDPLSGGDPSGFNWS